MKNTYQNLEQDRRLSEIEKHIDIINSEMGEVNKRIAKIGTNVCWLKKLLWAAIIPVIGTFITTLFNLI